MSEILKKAMEELGVIEIPGSQHHNSRIVEYARQSGFTDVQDDETPWCSIFVNWVCEELNLPRSKRADARSWLAVGAETNDPKPGDVVVFWRESPQSWKGHVAIFMGFAKNGDVFCLGGNQRNSVSIATYGSQKVLGYRRVTKTATENEIPEPVLRNGSSGAEVRKLQILLNEYGFNCGRVDSDFGTKTENALKKLQTKHRIDVDGIYGNQSGTVLESLSQS